MGSRSLVVTRTIVTLAALASLASYAIALTSAWSNGGYSSDFANPDYGTHDWIAEASLGLQTLNVSLLKSVYDDEFLLGTEAPDNPAPGFIGDTGEHHVYYWSNGDLQDDSSAMRAREMYRVALDELNAGDEENAAFHAGAMTHYIADLGVFGHTMGSSTDWGSEAVHQDYEEDVDNALTGRDFPASIPLEDIDPYNATLGLALKVTFGSGGVRPNVWMDDNFDWADAAYRSSAFAAVNESVRYVGAAINHLLKAAGVEQPTPDPPVTPPQPSPSPAPPTQDDADPMDTPKNDYWPVAGIVAAVAAVTVAAVMVARALSRK